MKHKKLFSLLCAIFISINCCSVAVGAEYLPGELVAPAAVDSILATGRLDMDIPARRIVQSDSSFLLAAGDEVTINASYWPSNASMDFGLIAPDGLFYSINVSNGSINETIEVDQQGYYTLAIRNNSNNTVSVTGFLTC